MKLRTIAAVLFGLVLGIVSMYLYMSNAIKDDFILDTEIPQFSKEEQMFIEKNICNILSSVKKPHDWYISKVSLGDTSVVVLDMLGTLQVGGNSKGTAINTVFDGRMVLEIDRGGNIIARKK